MENTNPSGNVKKLSATNLHILEDELGHESVLVHKYQQAADMCTDPQLKQLCSSVAQKHTNHFNTLYDYLNSHQ
ncbi:MAG TPA: hypothetical protein VFF14_10265 [Candidatus Deferrimicrobium sp.]|nr:hypothetical protein [Candidatus Deferrimicrobium sp.]